MAQNDDNDEVADSIERQVKSIQLRLKICAQDLETILIEMGKEGVRDEIGFSYPSGGRNSIVSADDVEDLEDIKDRLEDVETVLSDENFVEEDSALDT